MHKTTFTIEDNNFIFLNSVAGKRKSVYVNKLLAKDKMQHLKEAVLKANQEEAADSNYQKELADWDTTLSDGIDE